MLLSAVVAMGESLREPEAGIGGQFRNLFLNAKASADKTWSKQVPALAVNGNRNISDHWAGPPIPATHTIDLGNSVEVNTIRLITYWRGRYYQYRIEHSTDNTNWQLRVDQSGNTTSGGPSGKVFEFDTVKARYIRTVFTKNSANNNAGGHIVEIEGYFVPKDGGPEPPEAKGTLEGAAGSVDTRYQRDATPELPAQTAWAASAWRGERVHAQFVLWSEGAMEALTLTASELRSDSGGVIPAVNVVPRFVRYTMGAGQILGDILEPARPYDFAAGTTRPVWLTVNVPPDASPGDYTGTLAARDAGGKPIEFQLKVTVQPHTLPAPEDWGFHLDLWQHPWAIARVHRLEPWSPGHWKRLGAVQRMAADAGQKCLTVSILNRPWGHQTHDPFDTMIKSARNADGSWSYDYTLFDQYVEFGMKNGITQQINCYSMVPWGNILWWYEDGKLKSKAAPPHDPFYAEYWGPFLKAFSRHLKGRGWFGRTAIAMDERHLKDMQHAIAIIDENAPGMKIALAANKNLESIIDRVHDYCFFIRFKPNEELNARRTAAARKTTYYVCCGPGKPNTFTFSPPAESTWLAWHAAAHGYDGLLRWALCSFTADPFMTTDYPRRRWPTGDCYLIYPGPRSSIRFERLREGIQDYEKIRVLRDLCTKRDDQAGLREIDAMLDAIVNRDHTNVVNQAKRALKGFSVAVKP